MMQAVSETERSVQEIARAAGRWNAWSVRLVAATALVAALYFIATWMANKRGSQLSAAQATLLHEKDDQLARDLKAKDDQIAATYKEARRIEAEANQKIADTNKETKRIEADAGRKIEEAKGEAQTKIEQARAAAEVQIAAARGETEEVRKQNLATEARLGAEQDKRLEMEKSLAPREIPLTSDEHGKLNVDVLKEFAGTHVVFRVLPDAEAIRAANNIAWLLEVAGFAVSGFSVDMSLNTGYFDGVVVDAYKAPKMVRPAAKEDRAEFKNELDSERVTQQIAAFLTSNNWVARPGWATRGELTPNTVKINVGFKPSKYFSEKSMRDSENARKRSRSRDLRPSDAPTAMPMLRQLPKSPVRIACANSADGEPCSLAQKIRDLLKSAGWEVEDEIKRVNAGMPPAITILARNDPVPTERYRYPPAKTLEEVLSSFRLEVEVDRRTEIESPFIGIWVGVAPKPGDP